MVADENPRSRSTTSSPSRASARNGSPSGTCANCGEAATRLRCCSPAGVIRRRKTSLARAWRRAVRPRPVRGAQGAGAAVDRAAARRSRVRARARRVPARRGALSPPRPAVAAASGHRWPARPPVGPVPSRSLPGLPVVLARGVRRAGVPGRVALAVRPVPLRGAIRPARAPGVEGGGIAAAGLARANRGACCGGRRRRHRAVAVRAGRDRGARRQAASCRGLPERRSIAVDVPMPLAPRTGAVRFGYLGAMLPKKGVDVLGRSLSRSAVAPGDDARIRG